MSSTQRYSQRVLTYLIEHCFSQDGTDYWLGGLDADRDQGLQWMSGMEMAFTDFVKDQPNGLPYLHMNFDSQFK